jgi:hypothetical protein
VSQRAARLFIVCHERVSTLKGDVRIECRIWTAVGGGLGSTFLAFPAKGRENSWWA